MIKKIINNIINAENTFNAFTGGMFFSAISAVVISFVIFFINEFGNLLLHGDSASSTYHYVQHFTEFGLPIVLFCLIQVYLLIAIKKHKRNYLILLILLAALTSVTIISTIRKSGYPSFAYIYGYLINQPFDQKPFILPLSASPQQLEIPKFGVYEIGLCAGSRAASKDYSINTEVSVDVLAENKLLYSFTNNYSKALDIYDFDKKTIWAFKYLHIPITGRNVPITVISHLKMPLQDSDLRICVKPTRGYVQ